jgi:hypothetical protein
MSLAAVKYNCNTIMDFTSRPVQQWVMLGNLLLRSREVDLDLQSSGGGQ